jgi:hypothetical protein
MEQVNVVWSNKSSIRSKYVCCSFNFATNVTLQSSPMFGKQTDYQNSILLLAGNWLFDDTGTVV